MDRTGGRSDPQIEHDVTSFDFDYRALTPSGTLGRFVESIWYARGRVPYRSERIAPTGSTVGIVVLGDPIAQTPNDGDGERVLEHEGLLVGPHDRPIVNEPTGETFAVGIVTTPIGCEAVFGVRPATIRGSVAALGEHWSDAQTVRRRLLGASEPAAMIALAEVHLHAAVSAIDERVERCERAVALLEEDPTSPVALIADRLGVSHGYLDREFTRIVGLTPRSLARLLRVRRLLEGLEVHGSQDWSSLAVELGWFDQAHLIRDFKRHTGVTPTHYVEAQRSVRNSSPGADTAGFVPEF
jgi:AraC-like DNA-binding protein